jgi:xylan 1,4-beta-xylosidase
VVRATYGHSMRIQYTPGRWLLLVFLTLLLAFPAFCRNPSAAPSVQDVTINAGAPGLPFPHFWEQMFGSGRAILSLRASYRHDLRTVQHATGVQYVRFHGIFDHDVAVYSVDAEGHPQYNFSYVDQIYDGLLKHHVRPFVELSFMPRQLASTGERQAFWYHPYVSPPRSWVLWGKLIEHFARHLVARYGIAEVSQWYFEVWNEPNLGFWAGKPAQETYFHLYDVTARALKSVSPRLRVGGPATAQAAWASQFIHHCFANHVPVDFVSTHVYGNDTAENVFGTSQPISRKDMVWRAVRKVHDEVASSPLPHLPIILSEFNAAYDNNPEVTDSAFIGPWMAYTIRQCDGLVRMMSYWTFSDVFEEQGVVKTPFYGGFGLIAEDGIPKASFNDFRLLHMLGHERLAAASNSVIVTRRGDGSLAVAVWNYAPPGPGGREKIFHLSFENLNGTHHAVVWIVDSRHGSPLPVWRAMGSPRDLTRSQTRILREAGQLPGPRVLLIPPANPAISVRLAPHALALVEVTE